jgi:beta-lactamase superfamily II metal-dependent hydrolase
MSLARISVLDVGHGSAVLIQCGEGSVLIDTGRGASTLQHLTELSCSRLDRVLISHADADHCGALVNLLANSQFTVHSLWLNSDAFKNSELWTAIAYEIDDWRRNTNRDVRFGIQEGDVFRIGRFNVEIHAPRTRLTALGAGAKDRSGRRIESNTMSLLVRVSHNGSPVITIPGDMDALALEHFLDQSPVPDVSAPFLLFPHHGGNVGRAADADANRQFATSVMSLVQPSTVLFSIGRGTHGTPRFEVVDTVRRAGSAPKLLCTELSQNCHSGTTADLTQEHILNHSSRGLKTKSCCAGTVQLTLVADTWVVSPGVSHDRFISNLIPHSLCRSHLSAQPPS